MKYKKYFDDFLSLIIRQKILFTVLLLTFFMLITIIGMPTISNNSFSRNNESLSNSSLGDNFSGSQSSITHPPSSSYPPGSYSEINNSEPNLFTKFVYLILPFTRPSPTPVQNLIQNNTGRSSINTSYQPSQNPTQFQANQTDTGSLNGSSDNSSGNNAQGSSSTGNTGSSGDGGYSGPFGYSPTPTPTPINIVYVPTPTPVTDIQIVFEDEGGDFWEYTPPDDPPIDTDWSLYTNHQDNYSIEIPADWQLITSDYNGHESITLYNPANANTIEKPSIAFVGWQANYLSSAAKYTGKIILNDTPGTIYTNGFLGPSSIAAVFTLPNGYFALGSSITDPVFIYVFDHMLRSIEFNVN